MKNAAIYARKSIFTGKGESVENQIQLCKNYLNTFNSQSDIKFIIYEDEGFSGKNTNRPKFKELIKDIKNKKIDILICYRLDRISRNVADFSDCLELLQKFNVTFISLKEQFDTSTPMGRAMIYIASVFAQLERETIAERVKDNMIELAKMGKWSGGQLPLGFTSQKITSEDKTFSILIPLEAELKIVKFIYCSYLNYPSFQNVLRELNKKNYRSKNGAPFGLSIIKRALSNPLYVKSNAEVDEYLKNKGLNVYGYPNGNGYLTYNKCGNNKTDWVIAVSKHAGIIDAGCWLKVQHLLNKNKSIFTSNRTGTGHNNALFAGLLKCSKCGFPMVIRYSRKNKAGNNYIYYACSCKKCCCPSLRTDIIDNKLLKSLKIYTPQILSAVYEENFSKNCNKNSKTVITKKEKQAHNLIMQLANTSNKETCTMIINEIDTLNNEIETLKGTFSNSSTLDLKPIINDENFFNKYLKSLPSIESKRLLLRKLIKEIVFDYENKSFIIKFCT